MSKKTKKIIVNGLTFSRILGTIFMPFMCIYLDSFTFLIVVGLLLLTDFFDGRLALLWNVRTIFGSLLDMLADKLFALSVLSIVGIIYPIMFVTLLFEILITFINIYSAYLGIVTKSRELGRIKMWVLGLSIFILLITGMNLELKDILLNINLFDFLINNINSIEHIAISFSICAEFIVFCDYFIVLIKDMKLKNKSKLKVSGIKENMDFIKSVLFDEEYYIKTVDKSIGEKLLVKF